MSPLKLTENGTDGVAMQPLRLRVYLRTYCHLCHDLLDRLQSWPEHHRFSVEQIDIDQDPDLEERYGTLIPVLTDDQDQEICHYFLDEHALTAYLGKIR